MRSIFGFWWYTRLVMVGAACKEPNWLPTPSGQFNLTLRNYFPKEAAWDGSYQVPPVRKVQ